jgi:hypothetical protein
VSAKEPTYTSPGLPPSTQIAALGIVETILHGPLSRPVPPIVIARADHVHIVPAIDVGRTVAERAVAIGSTPDAQPVVARGVVKPVQRGLIAGP